MPASKPVLAITTPVSASFPAEALRSAASSRTPHSAPWRSSLASAGLPSAGLPSAGLASPAVNAIKTEDAFVKTPITPPTAYMDFLKFAASPAFTSSPTVASPPPTSRHPLNRTSTAGSTASVNSTATSSSGSDESTADAERARDDKDLDSGPSTATTTASEATDCSCDCEHIHKSPSGASKIPPSPYSKNPLSAPVTGPSSFPSLRIPPSPAASNPSDTPTISPFSARSAVRSPFDWEALCGPEAGRGKLSHSCAKHPAPRAGVRHIREVVTRTVTYTPRMEPAPKGKRRKVE